MGNEEQNYDYNNERFQINLRYILNCLKKKNFDRKENHKLYKHLQKYLQIDIKVSVLVAKLPNAS